VGELTLETIELAKSFVELIFGGTKGKIIGASIINLVATEGFFILGKTIPRVIVVGGRSHAPEVKNGFAGFLGIENHLN